MKYITSTLKRCKGVRSYLLPLLVRLFLSPNEKILFFSVFIYNKHKVPNLYVFLGQRP